MPPLPFPQHLLPIPATAQGHPLLTALTGISKGSLELPRPSGSGLVWALGMGSASPSLPPPWALASQLLSRSQPLPCPRLPGSVLLATDSVLTLGPRRAAPGSRRCSAPASELASCGVSVVKNAPSVNLWVSPSAGKTETKLLLGAHALVLQYLF